MQRLDFLYAESTFAIWAVAGVTTNGLPFTVIPPPAQVTGISIVPSNPSMLAGESRDLTVFDNNGNPVTGIAWTSSDPNVASFDSSGLLTANSAGQVTVTATDQSLTAQTTVMVYVGVSFPTGTLMWSAPPISGTSWGQVIPATPTGTNATDFFAFDDHGDSNNNGAGYDGSVRGLTADGKQVWTSPLVSNVILPYFSSTLSSNFAGVPDHNGGLLLKQATIGSGTWNLVKIDGNTGKPAWVSGGFAGNGDSPGSLSTAVHPDGTIYVISESWPPYPDGGYMGSFTVKYQVTALDGTTGTPKFKVNLPSSSDASTFNGYPWVAYVPSGTSALSITPDGSVYAEILSSNRVEAQSSSAPGGGTASYDDEIILVKISSDGSYTQQTLKSYTCSGSFNPCVSGVPYWTLAACGASLDSGRKKIA